MVPGASSYRLGKPMARVLRKNLLLIFSALYLLYGLLAGGDMTRIIFLGFPFIMTAILYELLEVKPHTITIITLLALPLTSLFYQIPDPAFEWERWQSWYPEFAPLSTLLILAVFGLISLAVLFTVKRT